MTFEQINAAINAAAAAAANEVWEFAAKHPERDDYEQLEQLARRVQRRAVKAGVAAVAPDRPGV